MAGRTRCPVHVTGRAHNWREGGASVFLSVKWGFSPFHVPSPGKVNTVNASLYRWGNWDPGGCVLSSKVTQAPASGSTILYAKLPSPSVTSSHLLGLLWVKWITKAIHLHGPIRDPWATCSYRPLEMQRVPLRNWIFNRIQFKCLNSETGTSSVDQWLRIRLPMQRTWVWSLVRKLSLRGATVPQLERSLCAATKAWHNQK